MNHNFMSEAIRLSIENIEKGGGPFGAVIVKDGEIIAHGVNRVTSNKDPTAHAEICAIRNACKTLNTFNLEGCDIYSSCEPCPMCLSAIYWAHISHLYYGNTAQDAKEIGFDDSFIYSELSLPQVERKLPALQIMENEAIEAFHIWEKSEKKEAY
ncbi:MAG: nucleoside deaminase [Bacteroidaceae bacterium]